MQHLTPIEQRALANLADKTAAAVKALLPTVDSLVKERPALCKMFEGMGDRLNVVELRSKLLLALADGSPEAANLREQLVQLERDLAAKYRSA